MSGSVLLQLDPTENAGTIRARIATARNAGFDGIDWTTPAVLDAENPLAAAPAFDSTSSPLELPVAVVSARCPSIRLYDALDQVSTAIADTSARGAGVLCLTLPPLCRDTKEPAFASYQDGLNLAYRVLHDLRIEAAAAGVVLALEVPQRGFLLSPVETRELIDEANAWNVGVCADLDRIAEIGLPADWLRTLGLRVHAVRVGTNRVRSHDHSNNSNHVADVPPEIKALLANDRAIILSRHLPESRWSAWLDIA